MSSYSVDLDLTSALAPPSLCPACDAPLLTVRSERGPVFSCPGCRQSWRRELGTLVLAGPDRRDEEPPPASGWPQGRGA